MQHLKQVQPRVNDEIHQNFFDILGGFCSGGFLLLPIRLRCHRKSFRLKQETDLRITSLPSHRVGHP